MTTWASIARTQPAEEPTAPAFVHEKGQKVIVVDANGIIGGVRLDVLALGKLVTIQEVLDEIRDKQSRQFLATLPFPLGILEPTEDSVKTVSRFAKETGDIQSLSSTDVKLLALAHTLEVAAHGSAHLHQHPRQVRVKARHRTKARDLPGWGRVPNPEDWKVVDEAPDVDAPDAHQLTSRIQQHLQALNLGDGHEALHEELGGHQEAEEDNDDTSGDEGGEWEVAARSAAAQRRRRKKAWRRQTREQESQEHANSPRSIDVSQTQQVHGRGEAREGGQEQWAGTLGDVRGDSNTPDNGTYPPGHEQDNHVSKTFPGQTSVSDATAHQSLDPDDCSGCEVSGTTSPGGPDGVDQAEMSHSGTETDVEEDEEEDEEVGSVSWVEAASEAASSTLPLSFDSTVTTITGDFAMQNVLLQMGLKLATKEGQKITRLTRWALRCSACFFVTKEVGRVFCPKCGNLAMDRVEITVGPDGAEYFGIKKKHNIRGTKYSLPKPKGGRNNKEPILREDVMMMKLPRKQNKVPDAGGLQGDPLAGWYNGAASAGAQLKGLSVLTAPWRNNPNERKPKRSNRRR